MDDSENCRVRCKNMMYTQQLEHLPAKTVENLTALIEKTSPRKYALIVRSEERRVRERVFGLV